MNSGLNLQEPEPSSLEDKIAHTIENTLEPFVVALLAALIAPSQCAQGIDQESEDQRRRAITLGRMLVNETRANLRSAYPRIEQHALAMEARKQRELLDPAESWLYVDMRLGDDSFREYLRKQGAPRKIQLRDGQAHYLALVDFKLGAMLLVKRGPDGALDGYHIPKRIAAEYLQLERQAGSKAVAKSRQKSQKPESR